MCSSSAMLRGGVNSVFSVHTRETWGRVGRNGLTNGGLKVVYVRKHVTKQGTVVRRFVALSRLGVKIGRAWVARHRIVLEVDK